MIVRMLTDDGMRLSETRIDGEAAAMLVFMFNHGIEGTGSKDAWEKQPENVPQESRVAAYCVLDDLVHACQVQLTGVHGPRQVPDAL